MNVGVMTDLTVIIANEGNPRYNLLISPVTTAVSTTERGQMR